MKTYWMFVLTLAMATLTACGGPNYIAVKPSTESLGALMNTATGNVHVRPTVKGPEVTPSDEDATATDLSPSKSSHYATRDDAVSAINETALDAIRQAGYTVTSGNEAPANTEIEVAITLKEVIAAHKRNSFLTKQIKELAVGDFAGLEGNVFTKSFSNTPTGGVITEVMLKNMKTGATFTHLVSGTGNNHGFLTDDKNVELALREAIEKYKVNLVRAIDAFKKGLTPK